MDHFLWTREYKDTKQWPHMNEDKFSLSSDLPLSHITDSFSYENSEVLDREFLRSHSLLLVTLTELRVRLAGSKGSELSQEPLRPSARKPGTNTAVFKIPELSASLLQRVACLPVSI